MTDYHENIQIGFINFVLETWLGTADLLDEVTEASDI